MKRYFFSVCVVAMLCMPSLGQTMFMEARPGATVDLTDPLNPTVDAGNPISIDIFLDGTVTPAEQVVAADIGVTFIDTGGSNPGTFDCSDFVIDEKRKDFLLDECTLCSANCGINKGDGPTLGMIHFTVVGTLVDFVAHVGTVTFLPSSNAGGDWEIGYAQEPGSTIVGGLGGSIINIVDDPESFFGLTVTVVSACTTPDFVAPEFGVSFSNRAWDGYIDGLRESNNGIDHNQGLNVLTVEFTTEMKNMDGSPISADAFTLVDTAGTPPDIDDAFSSDGGKTVTLELTGLLSLQEWSTFSFSGRDVSCDQIFNGSIDIGVLPCDVTQDGKCNPLDVTRFRQYVNNVLVPTIGVETDFSDINRNGSRNPLDLTALRQLVFGTGNATKVWASEQLPARP